MTQPNPTPQPTPPPVTPGESPMGMSPLWPSVKPAAPAPAPEPTPPPVNPGESPMGMSPLWPATPQAPAHTTPAPDPGPPPHIVYPDGPPGSHGPMGMSPLWPTTTPKAPDGAPGAPMPRSTLDGIHGTRDDDPVRWHPSHPGELPPYWMNRYVQDKNDPDLWWPDKRPDAPGSTHPASYDPSKDGKKGDGAGQANKLDVNPADLNNVANQYADLQRQAAAIGPAAVDEVNRIIATHGAMGYPVAVGVVAGLAQKQAAMEAKTAQWGVYADRFNEHAATYRGQDAAGAAGYQQVQFSA